MGQLRRRWSLASWKANTNCLLARTNLCGEGVSEAGKRRHWQKLEELKMRKEMDANFRAQMTGRSIVRKGRFWLD